MGSGAGFYVHGDLERTKQRRSKRTAFDKNLRYYKNEGVKNIFPKVSEIKLKTIREKIKKQQRKERNQLILAFVLAVPVSIFLVKFFFDFVQFLNS
ncbi:hypothetical protein [Kordia jejudonensis]|uniref:hypothetical protein n=1 Tax=Kordia jejudonensis TaxID=1348245 RepID=UPI000629B5CE|nr:hypothetical protein [Kordia jejudonensis]